MNAAIAQPPFTYPITWLVVIERSGTHHLHSMRLRVDMSIKTVMEEILALYYRKQPWWSHWLSRHVVEITTLARLTTMYNTNTNIDIDTRFGNGQEVRITERRPSDLISAVHELSAAGFRNPDGAYGFPDAILLRPKLTYFGLCILAVAFLLAIVIPGVLLGVITGQAGLGVALSAAFTAIFTLVGKLCGWLV